MRLNRFLALAGLGARRKTEELIREGRIEINGETVDSPAVQIDPDHDDVTCDGERVRPPRNFLYLAMNKPSGLVVSASDEHGRATVYDLLPERLQGKVRSVGRLDAGSEGLLLFTNDGLLAHALLHPSREVERTYLVWVTPVPGRDAILALKDGVSLGRGEYSGPAQVRLLGARKGVARLRLTLKEGKNREVRRMLRAVGSKVLSLRRVRFDGILLEGLGPGHTRPLTEAEVAGLRKAAGLPAGD